MLRAKFKAAAGSKLDSIDFNPSDYVGAEDKFLDFCKRMYDLLKDNPERARLDLTFDLRTKTAGLDWASARTAELTELRSRQLDVAMHERTLFDVAQLRVPELTTWVGIGCPNTHWRIDGTEFDGGSCPRNEDGGPMSCENCWGRRAPRGARAHANPHLVVGEDGMPVDVPASHDN